MNYDRTLAACSKFLTFLYKFPLYRIYKMKTNDHNFPRIKNKLQL